MGAETLIFVGTYTEAIRFGTGEIFRGKGGGIHIFAVDLQTGELREVTVVSGTKNPSYLCFAANGRFLYAVNELKSHDGGEGGTVSSFAVSPRGDGLTLLNVQPTGGTDPCHVTTDNSGRYVMVANFMSGSVSVYPLRPDGSLDRSSAFVQHTGSSVDAARQAGPHAHSSVFDPGNRFVFVPDLGSDRVIAYRFDSNNGTITEARDAGVTLDPGAGPRHLVFSSDGAYAYVINELSSSIASCAYEPRTGRLVPFQTIATLPEGFGGNSSCADISIHPSGAFLYASNRGHDSIVAYRRNAETGELSLIGHESCGGEIPRNFAIDATGSLMLVGNQASDTIVPLRIDQETGELHPTGHVTRVGSPVCIKFVP